jgi:DNA-directed RNA polymerase subunit RPC12/RpoP
MALDGNAIGGLLLEIFATDMTSAEATCARCGAVFLVAETMVYLRGPGTVARCRTCSSVLMVISRVREMNCVDLGGLQALQVKADTSEGES